MDERKPTLDYRNPVQSPGRGIMHWIASGIEIIAVIAALGLIAFLVLFAVGMSRGMRH